MLSCDDDGDQGQILNDFRRVASAHVEEFLLRKDHVLRLLGSRQNPESGRFREELVREFLRKLLPRNVGVDTGFIYGFEQVGTSDQLDVIIWDHGCHAPVLNAGPFVIVAPESVIAVVSVKSKMTTEHLRQGIDNLASVAPLDLTFRKGLTFPATGRLLPAIAKFLLFFSQPDSHNSMLRNGAETVRTAVHRHEDMEAHLVQSMRAVDPFRRQDPMWDEARRVLPRHIAVIEPGPANYVQGWGPPRISSQAKRMAVG